MARLALFDPLRLVEPPNDPLDKMTTIIALIILLRLVGGC
jgi:hypothetical protein